MSETSLKVVLLVEDNPGDALLMREMFALQATELTHVESMGALESHLARMPSISSCSTWDYPMRRAWRW